MLPFLGPEFIAVLFPQESYQQPTDEVSPAAGVSPNEEIRQEPVKRLGLSAKLTSILVNVRDRFHRKRHKRSALRLRRELNKMLQITLSTVDYATKSYSLGSSDIAYHAISQRKCVNFFGGNIMIACHKSSGIENAGIPHVGSAEYAYTISSALFAICQSAHRISRVTIAMLENDCYQKNEPLARIGDTMLQFLRLFTIAFGNESSEHLMNLYRRMDEYRCQLARQRLQVVPDQLHASQGDANIKMIASSLESMVQDLFTAVETFLRFVRPAA